MPIPNQPNILWICTDQQRYDTIGALGNRYVRTPNIDRLAKGGVAFTHAFCQSPICTPSRGSFLTGMYPSSAHCCMNGNERWSGTAPLVTKLLADAGYDTGLVGKLHLAGAAGRMEPRGDDGYRVFHWSHAPRDNWPKGHAYADWLSAKGFDLAVLSEHPEQIPVELHQASWCAEQAVEFIEEERERPWLLSVNPFDPHPLASMFAPPEEVAVAYDPDEMPDPLFRETDLAAQASLSGIDYQTDARRPEEFSGRAIRARYYAMIEMIDRMVGRLMESLDRSRQRHNTVVIFMSDHGEMLGDHGLRLKGCRFYEGLVRVPLIISWPASFQAGVVSDALVELIDVAPTLLDACKLDSPDAMQGRSLLPILTGAQNLHDHRDFVRCEYYRALNPDAPERRSGFVGSYGTMVRTRRHKLVVYHGHENGELFDLQDDPAEFTNLWNVSSLAQVRCQLLLLSFDALAHSVDLGPKQVAYY